MPSAGSLAAASETDALGFTGVCWDAATSGWIPLTDSVLGGPSISWSIVTELVATPTLSENLQWIRPGAVVDRHLAQITVQERFLEALDRLNPGERVLAANIRLAGNALHMPHKDAQLLFKHLVWTKAIVFDLKSEPIRLTGTIPDWRCMSPFKAKPAFEEAAA